MVIDNGNHLLLSGNHAALAYLRAIGAAAGWSGRRKADLPFVDLAEQQALDLADRRRRVPWWLFDANARAGRHSRPWTICGLHRLLVAEKKRCRRDHPCTGPAYDRFVQPLLLAALNIDPTEGSAALAGAIVRETLSRGHARAGR